ncbi:MAG: biopolymer transporter ExbD [Silicimonas sp.]
MIFARPRRHRKLSLTPMIDVVFLLLVFFMLAARFGGEGSIDLRIGTGSAEYSGPPRLVEVYPEAIRLNGLPTSENDLIPALADLTERSDDTVVLRLRDGANVQRLIDVMELLTSSGFAMQALVE